MSELDTAITDAMNEEEKSSKDESANEESTETSKSQDTKESDDGEKESEEEESTKSEPAVDPKIVEFYNMMQDPAKAAAYVKGLIKENEAVREGNEKSFRDFLSESIPDEYSFLVDGLADGLEKAVNHLTDAKVQKISQTVEEREDAENTRILNMTIKNFAEKYDDWQELDEKMADLAGEIPQGKQPLDVYMTRLYKLAGGKHDITKNKQVEKVKRIMKNRSESKPDSEKTATDVDESKANKIMSLTESVEAALKQEEERLSK